MPNETIQILTKRRSVRLYSEQPVTDKEKEEILHAAMRAPTAGNMMLYTIIEVADQELKTILAETCDHQPFIARAPWVLLFLADYQRWMDAFRYSGVVEKCTARGQKFRTPQEGDLFLACCDALIAAQTAVIAAESLGIGSCYIGDIMERYEDHRQLFALPRYAFPITLVCFGWPAKAEDPTASQPRFPQQFIVHRNTYQPLRQEDVDRFEKPLAERAHPTGKYPAGIDNFAQGRYFNKFNAEFTYELNRSVRLILQNWREDPAE